MSKNITEKAMLVRLHVSAWSARKYDRKVTEKVEQDFNAINSGRYNKVLISQDAVNKVQKTISAARKYHYDNTLPWQDDGYRILPACNFMHYNRKMREHKAEFEAAVSDFVSNYPAMIEEARERLNGMFNAADYPATAEISHKFKFDTYVMPIPDAGDFRVSLQAEDISSIQKDIQERVNAQVTESMRDLWERLFKAVAHAADKLSQPNAVFRDSLIGNLVELVNLLPRLNLTGDRTLEQMRQEVESKLSRHRPQSLRDSGRARKNAADDAKGIMNAMAAFMEGN